MKSEGVIVGAATNPPHEVRIGSSVAYTTRCCRTHNDLWDFDVPLQRAAGQIWVLDRATGEPMTDVQEVPVKRRNHVRPEAWWTDPHRHPGIEPVSGTDVQDQEAAKAVARPFSGKGAAIAVNGAGKKGVIKIVAMDRNTDMLPYIEDGTIHGWWRRSPTRNPIWPFICCTG